MFDLWTPEFVIAVLKIGFSVKFPPMGSYSQVSILKSRPKNQNNDKLPQRLAKIRASYKAVTPRTDLKTDLVGYVLNKLGLDAGMGSFRPKN